MRTPQAGTYCCATNDRTCLTRSSTSLSGRSPVIPERYESAGAFEAGLKHAQSSIAPQSGTAMVSTSTPTRPRGAQRTVLLLAAAGIIVAAGAVLLDVGHIRSRWSGGGSGASASGRPVGIAASTSQRRVPLPSELINVLGHPSRDGRFFLYKRSR